MSSIDRHSCDWTCHHRSGPPATLFSRQEVLRIAEKKWGSESAFRQHRKKKQKAAAKAQVTRVQHGFKPFGGQRWGGSYYYDLDY